MVRRATVIAIVFGLGGSGLAQKKEKKFVFPALIAQARYVYVTTVYGDPLSASIRIPPEDRKAAGDVQEALHKWGRFILAYRPADADLIFVVRKGRLASVTGGAVITTSPRGTAAGPIYGAEAGNPEDALLIYDAKLGTDGPALLKYIEKGGLDAPDIKLVAEFRKEAEAAAKKR